MVLTAAPNGQDTRWDDVAHPPGRYATILASDACRPEHHPREAGWAYHRAFPDTLAYPAVAGSSFS